MSKAIVNKISLKEYKKYFTEMDFKNIYVHPDYIDSLLKIYNIKLFAIEYKNDIKAIFPLLDKRKMFIKYSTQPAFTQFFNILIKCNKRSEQKRVHYFEKIITTYINFLRTHFHFFVLPQYYTFHDIREFIWNKVDVSIRYSYLFEINKENLQKIDRRIKNKEKMYYNIFKGDYGTIYDNLKRSYSNKNIPINKKNFIKLLFELHKKSLIDIFFSGKTFIVFLKDNERRTLYEYIVCGKNSGQLINSIFQSGIYDNCTFDFQGANTKSIAEYKALFNGELKHYFVIRRKLFGIYK